MDRKKDKKNRMPIWISIGAVILIILLVLWLTDAMFLGDTDVSAPPPIEAVMPLA